MKMKFIALLIAVFGASHVFAGGETGNGSPVLVTVNMTTGAIVSAEALDLYEARNILKIAIKEFGSESEVLDQAIKRLALVDGDFLNYFNNAILQQKTELDQEMSSTDAISTSLAEDTVKIDSAEVNFDVMDAAYIDDQVQVMEVSSLFNSSLLSATSRAAIQVQGAIYLLTLQFLPSGNSSLASQLMIQLLADEMNPDEISRLTHQVFPSEIRELLADSKY